MLAIEGLGLELEIETQSPQLGKTQRVALPRRASAEEIARLERLLRAHPGIQLVPGSVIACRAGDILPVDARVLEAHRFTTNEALLTGESEPQRKSGPTRSRPTPCSPSGPRCCTPGLQSPSRGHAVVVATGARTEMARIRSLIEQERAPRAPPERRMEELGRHGTWLSLGAGGLAAAGGLLRGQPMGAVLRNSIALAVAAIPEGSGWNPAVSDPLEV